MAKSNSYGSHIILKMNFSKTHNYRIVNTDFLYKYNTKNNKYLPKFTKLSLSAQNISSIELLELLTNKKPYLVLSKLSKSKSRNFYGCIIDLRKLSLYDFLDRFIFEILPSTKDLGGFKKDTFYVYKNIFAFNDANNLYNVLNKSKVLSINLKSNVNNHKVLSSFRLPVMDE